MNDPTKEIGEPIADRPAETGDDNRHLPNESRLSGDYSTQPEIELDADFFDNEILRMLQRSRSEHPSFGVGTRPGDPRDEELLACLERLESGGKVTRTIIQEDLIWWQSCDSTEIKSDI